MAGKKYKFNSLKDRALITTSAVAGVAAFAGGLSLTFNPVALGIVGAVGLASYGQDVLWTIPAYRKWAIKRKVKKGQWELADERLPIPVFAKDLAKQIGWSESPEVYMTKGGPSFASIPGANIFLVSNANVNLSGDDEFNKLQWILAHEMSHLKAKDNLSLAQIGARVTSRPALIATMGIGLAATGASFLGITLPVFAAVPSAVAVFAGIASLGGMVVARVMSSFAMRVCEQRADRNALAITRDLESAKSALRAVDVSSRSRTNYFKEAFRTHPSYHRRVKKMTKAFEKVSKPYLLPPPVEPWDSIYAAQKQREAAAPQP